MNTTPTQRTAETRHTAEATIPFDAETQWILGQPCFAVGKLGRLLHELGLYSVECKAEAEQAAVLHWELNLYLKHGQEWRKEAVKIIDQARATASESQAKEAQ